MIYLISNEDLNPSRFFQAINFGEETPMNMIMDDGGELTGITMITRPDIWAEIKGISEETATGEENTFRKRSILHLQIKTSKFYYSNIGKAVMMNCEKIWKKISDYMEFHNLFDNIIYHI